MEKCINTYCEATSSDVTFLGLSFCMDCFIHQIDLHKSLEENSQYKKNIQYKKNLDQAVDGDKEGEVVSMEIEIDCEDYLRENEDMEDVEDSGDSVDANFNNYYHFGKEKMKKGKTSKAIDAFLKAADVKNCNKGFKALMFAAKLLYNNKNYDKASDVINRIILSYEDSIIKKKEVVVELFESLEEIPKISKFKQKLKDITSPKIFSPTTIGAVLTKDLLFEIFSYLDIRSFVKITSLNKEVYFTSNNNEEIWRRIAMYQIFLYPQQKRKKISTQSWKNFALQSLNFPTGNYEFKTNNFYLHLILRKKNLKFHSFLLIYKEMCFNYSVFGIVTFNFHTREAILVPKYLKWYNSILKQYHDAIPTNKALGKEYWFLDCPMIDTSVVYISHPLYPTLFQTNISPEYILFYEDEMLRMEEAWSKDEELLFIL